MTKYQLQTWDTMKLSWKNLHQPSYRYNPVRDEWEALVNQATFQGNRPQMHVAYRIISTDTLAVYDIWDSQKN